MEKSPEDNVVDLEIVSRQDWTYPQKMDFYMEQLEELIGEYSGVNPDDIELHMMWIKMVEIRWWWENWNER